MNSNTVHEHEDSWTTVTVDSHHCSRIGSTTNGKVLLVSSSDEITGKAKIVGQRASNEPGIR